MAYAYHKPKKIKKHTWRSIDKAGTEPIYDGQQAVGLGLLKFAMAHGALDVQGNVRIDGDLENFAQATGRTLIFPDGKGGYLDRQGQPAKRIVGRTIVVPPNKIKMLH